jgi:hypothetical protein
MARPGREGPKRRAARPLPLVLAGMASSVLLGAAPSARGAETQAGTPELLVTQIVNVWQARDLEAYLALWDRERPEAVAAEREAVRELFASEECRLATGRGTDATAQLTLRLPAQAFCVAEPFGQLMRGAFELTWRPGGWRVASRAWFDSGETLVHLSLDPRGYKAAGHVLRLEDFELRMESGSLFTSPEAVGPTLLVFVGEGTVRFSPRPDSEKEEMRQFCGRTELVEKVRTFFLRIEPLDLERVLDPVSLQPDAAGPERYPLALQYFERHAASGYSLDSPLPRSPWWTFPPLGRSVAVFDTGRGTLTFAVTSQPEGISLFDRERRRQICLYPGEGQSFDYHEDEYNDIDVVHHDLRVRLDPERHYLQGEDTLRFRVRSDSPTIRLRLDEGLTVDSVTTASAVPCLFFRQRSGPALVVTLGALPPPGGETELTVRYSGHVKPAQRETEQLQTVSDETFKERWNEDALQVYSSEPDWYPQADFTDYATWRLVVDLPADQMVVSGGERGPTRVEDRRVISEYVQSQPTRYIVMAVGRLVEVGVRADGPVKLTGYGTAETRGDVPNLLARGALILDYFAELFGPPPYPAMTLAYTAGLLPGGHSPPAMTILSRRSLLLRPMATQDPADFSDITDFFLAHELAHQWWGHGVAPANYRERWLSEGLAHYAAALWVRHSQGEKAFDEVLGRMGRWARRETRRGPIFLGRRVGHQSHNSRTYRAVVYDKSAIVLHALAGVVGEQAFLQGLRDVQARARFQTLTTEDLRRSLEVASGQDLGPYLEQWVRTTTLPTLTWSDRTVKESQGWTTSVTVSPVDLPGPLPLDITAQTAEGAETVRRMLPPEGGVFTLTTRAEPRRIVLSGDWMVLLAAAPRRK